MASAAPTRDPVAGGASAGLYAWYVAALLAAGHLVSFVDRFVMSLVMEPLKADLGLSDFQLGLLQGTGFVILYTAVAIPLGLMADRINRRNLIIAGVVLWSLATGLCGLAYSFGSLFLARVGVGFGEAALVPAAMSLLAAYFPRRQLGRAVSLFTTGASLGKSAALIGGGAVLAVLVTAGGLTLPAIGRLEPWQGTFVLMAVPGLILALLMLTMREPPRPATTVVRPSLRVAAAYVRSHARAYALHGCAAAIVVLLIQSFAAWSPSFYVRFFGMTPSQAGVAIGSVILVAAPLGHLSGGALTDFFQSRGARSPAAPVMVIGLLAAIPCGLLFGTTRSLPLSLAAFGAMSYFTTLAAPASLAGVQMLTPDRLRGVVTSMFLAFTTFVGIGLGPPLIGIMTDQLFGSPQALDKSLMLTLTVLALVGAWLALASRTPFSRAAAASQI
jgi:MFS family permease